ncbi:neural cell adhesion molecule 2-like [Saccoglossus kowalevskii]
MRVTIDCFKDKYPPTDPPTITTSPSDETVHKTNAVTLSCEAARGKPATAVIYTWKKGSDDISIGGRYRLNGGSLTIINIVREDDGIYTCYASNGVGQPDSASATVTVYYPPTITTLPSDETVTEGSISLTLQCTATDGKPATLITYTWRKDDGDISIGGRYSLNGGSLTISTIVREDDGVYTCYASNGIGQPDSASATVTVYYVPVTYGITDYYSGIGDSISMNVSVNANPLPVTFGDWKNYDVVLTDKVDTLSMSTVFINEVRELHFGVYNITAHNDIGSVVLQVNLHHAGKGNI